MNAEHAPQPPQPSGFDKVPDALAANGEQKRVLVNFQSPSQVRAFKPPEGWTLVGNHHIQRGSTFVIGGAPGVGKSRAATALAVAGATRKAWFGLSVHRPFKTMILQAENGPLRLRDEYAALTEPELDGCIRVCPPPPFGFAFDDPEFSAQLVAAIAEFAPDVFILDPWNRATPDDKSKDYMATFNRLLILLQAGENPPALGIVAHTRKPAANEQRNNGRNLLNVLAGSHVLGSVPRSVFVIQHASDDPEETRVVFTCCKNNDGPLGEPTAWVRGNGLFQPAGNFDWDEFDQPAEKRRIITVEDLEAVFESTNGEEGFQCLTRKEAVGLLHARTRCRSTACYDALKIDGKFRARLKEQGGKLTLR